VELALVALPVVVNATDAASPVTLPECAPRTVTLSNTVANPAVTVEDTVVPLSDHAT